jgi:GAF domain-containing protein
MPDRRNRFLKTATRRYAAAGAAFGCLFPLIATTVSIWAEQLPFSLASAVAVQQSQPLLWIIDTAPIFLGFFAALAGRREDAFIKSNQELREVSRQLAAQELETERQLNQRTAQLRTAADVSQVAVSILDPDQLLGEVVNLIADRFGYYYAAIFTLDHDGANAVLREATGEAGRILKERGHRLLVNANSMVGYAVLQREPRVAQDATQDTVRFANPLLPDTRSEIAVPLIAGEQVLGALDVQSRQVNAFDESSIVTLQGLTNQIAVALSNARSFSELQKSFEYTTRQYELSRIIFGARTPRDAYAALGQAYAMLSDFDRISLLMVVDRDEMGEPLEYELATEWDVLGGAQLDVNLRYRAEELPLVGLAAPDEMIIIHDAADARLPLTTRERLAQANAHAVMLVPVRVRDRFEGLIVGTTEQARSFGDNEIRLMQSVAEQLGVVLSNLRLTVDMQATLERMAALNRRLSGETWTHYLKAQPSVVIESGQAASVAPSSRVDLPILVRGETIGSFSLADADPDRQWSDEELSLLNTIAGEAAQVIDNARLIEQTQRTAQREGTINTINTRVRQSVNLDTILRTAVSELGQSLKAARVVARVGSLAPEDAAAAGAGRGKTND